MTGVSSLGVSDGARDDEARDAIHRLERRVDGVELDADEREALAALPGRVIKLDGKLDKIDERTKTLSGAHDRLRDEFADMRGDVAEEFRAFRAEMSRRFDAVDSAHAAAGAALAKASTFGARFKDAMAIIGPIIVALIALAGAIYAARVGAGTK